MSSACSSDPVGAAAGACPLCEEQGIECVSPKKVPPITVKSLIKPEFQDDVPEGQFYFCPQKDCDAVYFGAGRDPIVKNQLSVGVWQKKRPGIRWYATASNTPRRTSWKTPGGILQRPFLLSSAIKLRRACASAT